MLKVIRSKLSIKETIEAWAERKNYEVTQSYQSGDGLILIINKKTNKRKHWFWGEITDSEPVLKYYRYKRIGKKAAEHIGEDCEGKMLYWFKVSPSFFSVVELLAEEIESEMEDKENKVVLVTIEK